MRRANLSRVTPRRSLLAVLLCAALAGAARAASPVDDYLAERDAAIARFKSATKPENRADRRELAALQEKLAGLIGPVAMKGLKGRGVINLETLQQDGGFGMLDGLRFRRGKEIVVVTTRALLDRYIAGHGNLPNNVDAALTAGPFYAATFDWDTAYTIYAELPVTLPSGLLAARAFLGLFSQDIGAFPPHEVLVAAQKGEQVFLVESPLPSDLPQLEPCAGAWRAEDEEAHKARAAGRVDDADQMEQAAFGRYGACYGAAAPAQPFFPGVLKRANDTLAAIAGR